MYPESNGFGADAVVLVYDAREKKVHSINAEGTAPKLATIDWYNKNNGGRIPNSDGLLSASLPGVIDAWYIMLDRWGTLVREWTGFINADANNTNASYDLSKLATGNYIVILEYTDGSTRKQESQMVTIINQ